jgi:hypothetical protein
MRHHGEAVYLVVRVVRRGLGVAGILDAYFRQSYCFAFVRISVCFVDPNPNHSDGHNQNSGYESLLSINTAHAKSILELKH